uniref:Ig-like domain-containing protein n=1 Tax=Parascaris equorum TaxID=6256 RepID=A0A914RM07_PAREQ
MFATFYFIDKILKNRKYVSHFNKVAVVEASRVATVAILGGSTQWLEPGSPTEIICAATGNSIIDRIQWVKTDGDLPPDVEDHNEPGILHFANFKVFT